jgi:vitamin B12 transporter
LLPHKLFVMTRILVTLAACFQVAMLFGQSHNGISDSVFQIQEFKVEASRLSYSCGQKTQDIDSSLLRNFSSSNLSQLLIQVSQLNVLSYGPGMSAISTRGSGATHTAVLWNDINLQDMFNGGVDVSQIPANFIDDIKIQYGGSSSLFGSGSIGGAIHLNNTPVFDGGIKARVISEYGSFSNLYNGFDITYSNKKYYGTVKAFKRDALNDYPYYSNISKTEKGEVNNARRIQSGVVIGNSFQTGAHSLLETNYWYQHNDQQIMLSSDQQTEDSHRASTSWKLYTDNGELHIHAGQNFQRLVYDRTEKYLSTKLDNSAEYNHRLSGNLEFNTGISYIFETGSSQMHVTNPQRNQYATFGSVRYSLPGKVSASASIRGEVIDKTLSPATYSVGAEYALLPYLTGKGNVSRNFRIPTFNDLYWKYGGNPNLKDENGFCSEVGTVLTVKHFKYELTGFSNNVTDWIQWQPHDSLWIPVNIGKVWARGVENVVSYNSHIGPVKTTATGSYSYTLSTKENKDTNVNPDPSYHKQLINVPRHKALATVMFTFKNYSFFYSHNYSGMRYSTVDNSLSSVVHSYQFGNLSLSGRFKVGKLRYSAGFTVNNIWNESYQVVKLYPMPLRNYLINIQLNFN